MKWLGKLVAVMALVCSALVGMVALDSRPAAAVPGSSDRLVGVALVDDVAYLVYEGRGGALIFVPID